MLDLEDMNATAMVVLIVLLALVLGLLGGWLLMLIVGILGFGLGFWSSVGLHLLVAVYLYLLRQTKR